MDYNIDNGINYVVNEVRDCHFIDIKFDIR